MLRHRHRHTSSSYKLSMKCFQVPERCGSISLEYQETNPPSDFSILPQTLVSNKLDGQVQSSLSVEKYSLKSQSTDWPICRSRPSYLRSSHELCWSRCSSRRGRRRADWATSRTSRWAQWRGCAQSSAARSDTSKTVNARKSENTKTRVLWLIVCLFCFVLFYVLRQPGNDGWMECECSLERQNGTHTKQSCHTFPYPWATFGFSSKTNARKDKWTGRKDSHSVKQRLDKKLARVTFSLSEQRVSLDPWPTFVVTGLFGSAD